MDVVKLIRLVFFIELGLRRLVSLLGLALAAGLKTKASKIRGVRGVTDYKHNPL
jgi:hypothetical protein